MPVPIRRAALLPVAPVPVAYRAASLHPSYRVPARCLIRGILPLVFARQDHGERAPEAELTLHANSTVMHLREALHQREAETGALRTLALRAVRLAELLEDQLVVLRVDAHALIDHPDLDRAERPALRRQMPRGDGDG